MDGRFTGFGADDSHVYQQGQGSQVNIENLYVSPTAGDSAHNYQSSIEWRKASEIDPLELGVHRAEISSGNAVPPYVHRDVDSRLRENLQRSATSNEPILIVGDSTAGKSRAVYEAIIAISPEILVGIPDNRQDLQNLAFQEIPFRESRILLVDEFDRYLGPDGMTKRVAVNLRRKKITLIAILRAAEYQKLSDLDGFEGSNSGVSERVIFSDFLNLVDPILIDRRWSANELARAETSKDKRIKQALEHSDLYGVAEYLAAGPRLLERWKVAQGGGQSPRGAALVSVAVDFVRAGMKDPIPLSLLLEAADKYLDRAGGPLVRAERAEDAVRWALQRHYGITGLLLPTRKKDSFRPFDYLPEALDREGGDPPPRFIWDRV